MNGKHSKGPRIVYIAGPMRGLPDLGRANFNRAEELLKKEGWIVLNPARLPVGMPDAAYMPICLAMVDQADTIALLPGYENSAGAQVEIAYGAQTNKEIIYMAEYGKTAEAKT